MTRRIAMAILLTVWAALAVAGAAAYVTARAALIAELDASLVIQASRLPELVPPRVRPPVPPSPIAAAGTRPARPPTAPQPGGDPGDGSDPGGALGASAGGRYVIRSDVDGRTIPPHAAAGADDREPYEPRLVSATSTTLPGGQTVRTVTLRALAPAPLGGEGRGPIPVTVVYSGPAGQLDQMLARLLWTIVVPALAAGVLAAAVAVRVSRLALRPLHEVAHVVGSVSERRLDRRVPVGTLPPELVPMGRRLNEMLARLQEAFALRRQFLADASHELRTPVAALLTGLELALRRDRPADAYRAALQSARADASHLRKLVERLMEQVRSEQFAHDAPAELVDLCDALAAAAGPARTLAAAQGVALRTSCPNGLTVRTQPARLRSIVENLLSNAVEYNRPGGSVTLTARAAGDGVEITVADTGVGMTPEQLAKAFEPFHRGDAARGTEAGHLGLGLSLVRTHVEALGGRCQCRSAPGEGSEFQVELPGRAADRVAGEPEAGEPEAGDPKAGVGAEPPQEEVSIGNNLLGSFGDPMRKDGVP